MIIGSARGICGEFGVKGPPEMFAALDRMVAAAADEQRLTLSEVRTAINAAPAMLEMLRSIEWAGSAGRCPHCQRWPETGPTDGLGNPTHEGHAKDCALAALIGAP